MTDEKKDGMARNAAKVIASVGAQANVVVPNSKHNLIGGSAENALNTGAESSSSGIKPDDVFEPTTDQVLFRVCTGGEGPSNILATRLPAPH